MDYEILEQCMGSVVRYIQNHADVKNPPIFDEIPENFMVPSLYFPVPWTRCKKVTLSTYRTQLIFMCQFLASTDTEAYRKAVNVRDCMLIDELAIQLMNKDGSLGEGCVRAEEPDIRRIERGVVQLSFNVNQYFTPVKDQASKIQKFNFNGLIKEDDLYTAWYAATMEQRKEQEAEQECLRKSLETMKE